MPYKDQKKRRAYDRERKRLARAGVSDPSPLRPIPRFKLQAMRDVAALLERAVELAEADEQARPIEQARALALIAGSCMRVLEGADLERRVEKLEAQLRLKGERAG